MEKLQNETKKTSVLDMEKSFINRDISYLFWLNKMETPDPDLKSRNIDGSVTIYSKEKGKEVKDKLRERLLDVVDNNSKNTKEWLDWYIALDNAMEKWISTQDIISKLRKSIRNNLKD